MGQELFAKATLIELDEQVRAANADEEHQQVINKLSRGETLQVSDLQKYQLLKSEDFQGDQSPWLSAPIVVSTNRERHTLTHPVCVRYAKSKGCAVIRWPAKYQHWQQKPSGANLNMALQDPCFFEYFVQGAKGFISSNINKTVKLVNGRAVQYHSIVPCNEEQEQELRQKLSMASPGDVITLDDPPAAVNVILTEEENVDPVTGKPDPKMVEAWEKYSVIKD